MLDLAINDCLSLIMSQYYKRKEPTTVYSELGSLVATDPLNTTSTGSGLREYDLPANFLYTLSAKYCNDGSHNLKRATLLDFYTAVTRESSTFAGFLYEDGLCENPTYYIRKNKIGFFPQPATGGANNYQHYYLAKPIAVTGTTGSTVLDMSDTMLSIVLLKALSFACNKDNRPQEAKLLHEQYLQELQTMMQ